MKILIIMQHKGIGIDIVKNIRILSIIESDGIHEIFSLEEIAYCNSRKNYLQSFSGIFAAKEAVIKVFKGTVSMRDIKIYHGKHGEPFAKVKNNDKKILISISHEDKYSVASAAIF